MDEKLLQLKNRLETVLKRDRQVIGRTDLTRAAVLIPIVLHAGEPHIILTKRSMTVATHKGQISFPGGMREKADKDAIENALRETEEEIGLSPERVTVIGLFDDFVTISGFVVTPVVGFVEADALLRADPAEVDEIIVAPVAAFTDPTRHEIVTETQAATSRRYHSYRIGGHLVWGATAGIIHRLLTQVDALDEAV